MLYDSDASPADRRRAFGLPPAPDADFERDWDSMDVASLLVEFGAPYTSSQHPTASIAQAKRDLFAKPDAACTTTLLKQKELERIEIDRERARRNGETPKELPPILYDTVFAGPEFLLREPKVRSKPQMFTKSSICIPRTASGRRSMMHGGMSAHFVADDRARATRECRQALLEALSHKRQPLSSTSSGEGADDDMNAGVKHRRLFYDSTFFVGARSALYPHGTPKDASTEEPCDVARLTQLLPDALVFDPDPMPYAIVSTTVRAHHIVAAMEVLRRAPQGSQQLMELLVTTDDAVPAQDFLFDHGMIGVVLFVDGCWDWVIVDDLVPLDGARRPQHIATVSWDNVAALEAHFGCRHTEADPRHPISWDAPTVFELWPLLVFKAVAKVLGCYAAVDAGATVADAVVMLTGYMVFPSFALSNTFNFDDAVQCLAELPLAMALLHPRGQQNTNAHARRAAADDTAMVTCSCSLPCILDDGGRGSGATFGVYSPWGTMRRVGASDGLHGQHTEIVADEAHYQLQLTPEEIMSAFELIEVFMPRHPSHPMVAFHAVSTPFTPTWLTLSISTAIQTEVLLSVEQADPKTQLYLPLAVRRTLPFACLSWRVYSAPEAAATPSSLVFASEERVARQVAALVPLDPGSYWIAVHLTMAPSVPLRVSVSAPCTAVLTLSRRDANPEVHGVCTRSLQSSGFRTLVAALSMDDSINGDGSPHKLLTDVMTRRASRMIKPRVPAAVYEAFQGSDITRRGQLGADAAQRALLQLILKTSPGGEHFLRQLRHATKGDATIDVVAFSELVQGAIANGGFLCAAAALE